jgi:hypothetical protein
MTIITPTGVTGINSITSSGNSLSFQNASGASIDVSGLKVAADSMNVSGIVTASGIAVSAGSTSAPSISPSGDSNTGIFFPSPDTIAFGEGGAEAFRVDSSGRLGIGTNNPSTEFEVFGTGTVASFRGTGGSGFIGIKDEDDGTLGFIGVDGGSIKLQTSGNSYADKLVVDSSGRTTLPYQPSFYTIGTNYTQSTGTSIIIPNVVSYNQGSHYNGSTGRFTAPIAGRYIFGFWGLSYPHNTEVNQIQGFVNGSGAGQLVQFNGTSVQHEECSGSLLLNLNANDVFDWRYSRSSGSAKAYNSQWNMWGYLLG